MKRLIQPAVAFVMALLLLTGTSLTLAQQARTHTVAAGQTLFSIALQYGVTVNDLAFANGITNPNLIFAGQVLTIPGGSTDAQAYTVVAGDTLFSIARRFGTSVSSLASANNISNPDQIQVGQTLTLPSPGGGVVTPAPTQSGAGTIHTVAAGETLFRIALRYGVTPQQIAAANNLTNVNTIFVGQRLTIPSGSAAPAATATQGAAPTQGTPAATATSAGSPVAPTATTAAPTATTGAAPTATETGGEVMIPTTDPGLLDDLDN